MRPANFILGLIAFVASLMFLGLLFIIPSHEAGGKFAAVVYAMLALALATWNFRLARSAALAFVLILSLAGSASALPARPGLKQGAQIRRPFTRIYASPGSSIERSWFWGLFKSNINAR